MFRLAALLTGALMGFMLRHSAHAARGAAEAAEAFALSVAPVLLPMLVLSLMLSSRLRGRGEAIVVLLGLVSGAPAGARLASPRRGYRALRIAAMTGAASPAFALTAAPGLLNISPPDGAALGALLLMCQWLGALGAGVACAAAARLCSGRRKQKPAHADRAEAVCFSNADALQNAVPCQTNPQAQPPGLCALSLPDALRTAADAMLTVCAAMMFFGALFGAAMGALPGLSAPARAALGMALEMSQGVRAAARLKGMAAPCAACAAMSLGGLSVGVQCMAFLRPLGVSALEYAAVRLCGAALSAALCAGMLSVCGLA